LTLDCLRLGEYINAVIVILHHLDHLIQMTPGNLQSVQHPVSRIHLPHFNPPTGDLSRVVWYNTYLWLQKMRDWAIWLMRC